MTVTSSIVTKPDGEEGWLETEDESPDEGAERGAVVEPVVGIAEEPLGAKVSVSGESVEAGDTVMLTAVESAGQSLTVGGQLVTVNFSVMYVVQNVPSEVDGIDGDPN